MPGLVPHKARHAACKVYHSFVRTRRKGCQKFPRTAPRASGNPEPAPAKAGASDERYPGSPLSRTRRSCATHLIGPRSGETLASINLDALCRQGAATVVLGYESLMRACPRNPEGDP